MQVKQQSVKYWTYSICWILNNEIHRGGDLPAIYNFLDGKLVAINYCQNNKYHRTIGPAYIDYKSKYKEYFYQDRRYASLDELLMLEVCR